MALTFQIILIAFMIVGTILVILSLPGTWLIVGGGALFSIFQDFNAESDWQVLLIIVVLAGLGEIIEYWTSIVRSKKKNVPTGAIIASIVGGLIGAVIGFPIFVIGVVLGMLVGTYMGAFIYSLLFNSNVREAFRVGYHVFCSRMVAIFAKTIVALTMSVYLLFKSL